MLEALGDQTFVVLILSIRVLVILSLTPVVSGQQSFFFVRVVLAVITVFSIQQFIPEGTVSIPQNAVELLIVLVGEALIGLILGFFIQIVFSLLSIISEFFTTQMGLRAAQVVNPITQTETIVIQQLVSILVLVVFLSSFTLQKIFYYGIYQSFIALNAQSLFQLGRESLWFIVTSFVVLFERSFLIAFPIFSSLFLINIGLGLIGKVSPQLNVLILGIPIQIGIGFLLMVLFIPGIVRGVEIVFDWSFQQMGSFIRGVS